MDRRNSVRDLERAVRNELHKCDVRNESGREVRDENATSETSPNATYRVTLVWDKKPLNSDNLQEFYGLLFSSQEPAPVLTFVRSTVRMRERVWDDLSSMMRDVSDMFSLYHPGVNDDLATLRLPEWKLFGSPTNISPVTLDRARRAFYSMVHEFLDEVNPTEWRKRLLIYDNGEEVYDSEKGNQVSDNAKKIREDCQATMEKAVTALSEDGTHKMWRHNFGSRYEDPDDIDGPGPLPWRHHFVPKETNARIGVGALGGFFGDTRALKFLFGDTRGFHLGPIRLGEEALKVLRSDNVFEVEAYVRNRWARLIPNQVTKIGAEVIKVVGAFRAGGNLFLVESSRGSDTVHDPGLVESWDPSWTVRIHRGGAREPSNPDDPARGPSIFTRGHPGDHPWMDLFRG